MIEIYCNGRKFSYWTEVNISRSLDKIAAGFTANLVTRDMDGNPLRMFPGDRMEVVIDNVTVIDGYIDKISSAFSNGSRTLSVSGSERTVDLVECCLDAPSEWIDKDFVQIISGICSKFGVAFSNKYSVDVGEKFKKFSAEPGAKALDTIKKLCNERGILACSDGLGGVYLLQPEKAKRGPALVQGENLISAEMSLSIAERYSQYKVLGTGKPKKKVSAIAKDGDVPRDRLLVVVDSNSVSKDKVLARAEWENAVRKAKSMSFHCSVLGWSVDGELWAPGMLCSFKAPFMGIDESIDLLVNSVSYSWNESSGAVTSLSLVDPAVFIPQPQSKKMKKGGKPDVWKNIKKKVKG